jgi:hypothetical protein
MNIVMHVPRMRCSASARRERHAMLELLIRAREWCTADPGPSKIGSWRSRVCSAARLDFWADRKGMAALRCARDTW